MREKDETQRDQRYTPRDWVAIKLTGNRIFFCVRRQAGSHQLCRAACIDSCKEPCAGYTQNKECHAISDYSHLKKAGKNSKVNNGF